MSTNPCLQIHVLDAHEIGQYSQAKYAGLCVLLLELAFLESASSLSYALLCWFDLDLSLPFVQ